MKAKSADPLQQLVSSFTKLNLSLLVHGVTEIIRHYIFLPIMALRGKNNVPIFLFYRGVSSSVVQVCVDKTRVSYNAVSVA